MDTNELERVANIVLAHSHEYSHANDLALMVLALVKSQKEKPMAIAEIETRPQNVSQARVIHEVLDELDRQNVLGYTPERDMKNNPPQWVGIITEHLHKAFNISPIGDIYANLSWRKQLVRVAALAVAAVVDYDRKVPSGGSFDAHVEPLVEGHAPDCKCWECGRAWHDANLGREDGARGQS